MVCILTHFWLNYLINKVRNFSLFDKFLNPYLNPSLGTSLYYSVTVETILSGHEDKIFGLHWMTTSDDDKLKLLSASLDKTMILWELDDTEGIWLEAVRVGEVSSNTVE
jgi:WD40 repeat protein